MTPFVEGYIRTMKVAALGVDDAFDFAGRALESPVLRDAGAVAGLGMAGMTLGDPKFWTSSPVDRAYYALSNEDERRGLMTGAAAAGTGLLGLAHPKSRGAARELMDVAGDVFSGL